MSSKEIHQLRILMSDLVASNRELRTRLDVLERVALEYGCAIATLNDMHGLATEEPAIKRPDPRKPLLQ